MAPPRRDVPVGQKHGFGVDRYLLESNLLGDRLPPVSVIEWGFVVGESRSRQGGSVFGAYRFITTKTEHYANNGRGMQVIGFFRWTQENRLHSAR